MEVVEILARSIPYVQRSFQFDVHVSELRYSQDEGGPWLVLSDIAKWLGTRADQVKWGVPAELCKRQLVTQHRLGTREVIVMRPAGVEFAHRVPKPRRDALKALLVEVGLMPSPLGSGPSEDLVLGK